MYDENEMTQEELQEKLDKLGDDKLTVLPIGNQGADIDHDAQDGHYNYNFDGPAPEQKDAPYNWKPEANTALGDEDKFQERGILFGEEADAAEKEAEKRRQAEREEETEKSRNTTNPDGDKLLEESTKAAEQHRAQKASVKETTNEDTKTSSNNINNNNNKK